MFGKIKDFIAGKSREASLSPYAEALNSASSNYNTAVQWNKNAKEYLQNNQDLDQNSNLYQTLSKIASDDFTKEYKENLDTYQDYWDRAKKQNQYNVFGTGVFGQGLNDAFQTGTALWDLGTSGTEKWKSGERDALSDVGAGINTGLNAAAIATGAAGLTGGLAAKPAATSIGQAVVRGAVPGVAYGGVGSLGNYLRLAGDESSLGDAALVTGLGAGVGGVLGGGLGAGTYGLGRLTSGLNKTAISNALSDYAKTGGQDEYQQALSTLQKYGVDTSSEDALNKTARKAILNASQSGAGADTNPLTTALSNAKNKLTEGNFAENMAKATAPVAGLDLSSIPRVPASSLQEALANVRSNIQASPVYNSRVGRFGVQAVPVAGTLGAAYLLGKSGRNNNNQTLANYYATIEQE